MSSRPIGHGDREPADVARLAEALLRLPEEGDRRRVLRAVEVHLRRGAQSLGLGPRVTGLARGGDARLGVRRCLRLPEKTAEPRAVAEEVRTEIQRALRDQPLRL